MRLLPIIGPQASWAAIGQALLQSRDKAAGEEFSNLLAGSLGRKMCLCVSSGLAAWYLILRALKRRLADHRTEVVLPAYTAGSLVVAVRAAGLVPVLCDVSLDDFNAQIDSLLSVISEKTLVVAGIHMFGIPMASIPSLAARLSKGVTLVEDCAQAQGAVLSGQPVGSFAQVSFWSFNRGKNMSLAGGGCVCADEAFLSACRSEAEQLGMTEGSLSMREVFGALALSVAVNPYVYAAAYRVVSRFKDQRPPRGVRVAGMSGLGMSLGKRSLGAAGGACAGRGQNGRRLQAGLENVRGLKLAKISRGSEPAFNRFPFLVEEESRIPTLERALKARGIESSRMYERPLHHMFDLGYRRDDFPGACYLAGHLLTLPVHPGVRERDIDTMVRVIKETL